MSALTAEQAHAIDMAREVYAFDAELAKRAVACKAWRWMDGMLDHLGRSRTHGPGCDLLPWLEDPATLGCLVALVREAHGLSRLCSFWDGEDDMWVIVLFDADNLFLRVGIPGVGWCHGATEAEAWVAALEAAP